MLPTPRAVMSVVRLSAKKYFENKALHNLPTLYKMNERERTMQRTYVRTCFSTLDTHLGQGLGSHFTYKKVF